MTAIKCSSNKSPDKYQRYSNRNTQYFANTWTRSQCQATATCTELGESIFKCMLLHRSKILWRLQTLVVCVTCCIIISYRYHTSHFILFKRLVQYVYHLLKVSFSKHSLVSNRHPSLLNKLKKFIGIAEAYIGKYKKGVREPPTRIISHFSLWRHFEVFCWGSQFKRKASNTAKFTFPGGDGESTAWPWLPAAVRLRMLVVGDAAGEWTWDTRRWTGLPPPNSGRTNLILELGTGDDAFSTACFAGSVRCSFSLMLRASTSLISSSSIKWSELFSFASNSWLLFMSADLSPFSLFPGRLFLPSNFPSHFFLVRPAMGETWSKAGFWSFELPLYWRLRDSWEFKVLSFNCWHSSVAQRRSFATRSVFKLTSCKGTETRRRNAGNWNEDSELEEVCDDGIISGEWTSLSSLAVCCLVGEKSLSISTKLSCDNSCLVNSLFSTFATVISPLVLASLFCSIELVDSPAASRFSRQALSVVSSIRIGLLGAPSSSPSSSFTDLASTDSTGS